MNNKSIRSGLVLISLVISVVVAITFFNYYLSSLADTASAKDRDILKLEASLFDTMLSEKASLQDSTGYSKLQAQYATLFKTATRISSDSNYSALKLKERKEIYAKLFDVQERTKVLYAKVNDVLPSLLESVRYIHEHHIAYMKNLLSRGAYTQDWDTGESFKRSSVRSAPEPYIIEAAVGIQTGLIDLLLSFYDLQNDKALSQVKTKFSNGIKQFYETVNRFEDYSLDAQDGLLVEELLINGRAFEDWFKALLNNEQTKELLIGLLDENRQQLLDDLQKVRDTTAKSTEQTKYRIRILQVITLVCSLALAIYIFFYSRKIANDFQRTIHETEKIRDDLSYQIQVKKEDFVEFRVVFHTLNSMAQTINKQIQRLELTQAELASRVEERTLELVQANDQLRKEMQNRNRTEEARLQLEIKLQRAQKMEAIGTLAGGVAHDLNSILASLVGYPELILLDMAEDHPLRKHIQSIKTSGEKAAAIVQDLLTLSRRGAMVLEVVGLNDIVKEYLFSPELSQLKSHHPGIEIELTLAPQLGNIRGSRVHLFKTIMNLMQNSAEAMPEGGRIKLATDNRYVDTPIGCYDDVAEGDYVIIEITDTGIGIAEHEMQRIFEPFFSKKVMGRSGTGLGMSVVWGTVKDHNGYIDVVSREGHGTKLTLYFPLCRDEVTTGRVSLQLEAYRGKGESILVVDDVPEQREIATLMLTKLGYSVKSVSNGELAVEFLKHEAIDLILLDMIMPPSIDGLETYKRILVVNPRQKAVIASGFSETERVKEAQRLGAGAYIKKPYTIEVIGAAVKTELNRYKGLQ